MLNLISTPTHPSRFRWWAPGILMAGLIGALVAADLLLNGLLNHLPEWLIVAALATPWILPLRSLFKRSWKESAVQAISLATGMGIGTAGLWFTYATLNQRTPAHPFPDSLTSAAASGTPIHEPRDPNESTLIGNLAKEATPEPTPQIGSMPPDLVLKKGPQGGMYSAEVRTNPGEPGTLFLLAFEHSSNTPLSESSPNPERQISIATRHPARYSAQPDEIFTSSVDFKLTDGVWGQFYAARIELWFSPASGSPPRRLHAKVFRVEGWQR